MEKAQIKAARVRAAHMGPVSLIGLAVVLLTSPCLAATYLVRPDGSGDFPNIQSAIQGAVSGDVIELADGVFAGPGNRDINFLGRTVTVRSQSAHKERCIIDCGASQYQAHRGFLFDSAEGPQSILEGVTIRHGVGSAYESGGGAIYCGSHSSPTLRDCVFLNNNTLYEGSGGAIFTGFYSAPQITGCAFLNNIAQHGGGALHAEGGGDRIALTDCVFEGNSAVYGGALDGGHYHLDHCTFRENSAEGGGAIATVGSGDMTDCVFQGNRANSSAGALFDSGGNTHVTRCVFSGNSAVSGGAIVLANVTSTTISSCTFQGNLATDGAAVMIEYAESQPVTFDACVFLGNTASGSGGALYAMSSEPHLTSCTLAGNSATSGSGLWVSGWHTPTLSNCILAMGGGGTTVECLDHAGVTLGCSDVWGNAGGDWVGCLAGQEGLGGNLSADPLFCDLTRGDLHLLEGSPCGPDQNPECGLIGAEPIGCLPPPVGACCFSDGSCTVLGQQQCADEQGSYQGNGTTCDPNPCHPTPTKETTWGHIKSTFR